MSYAVAAVRSLVAALVLIAFAGCGTAQKKPESEPKAAASSDAGSRAAKGAAGGAALGAVGCLSLIPMSLAAGPLAFIAVPVAIACLPVGMVAGAVVVGTAAAVTTPSRPGAAETPATAPSAGPEWKLVGRLEKNDAVPEGNLHVARVLKIDANETAGRLLVDFDERTPQGERSYLASARVNCRSGALVIQSRETYSEGGANGWRVTSENGPAQGLLTIERPTATLADAVQRICQ